MGMHCALLLRCDEAKLSAVFGNVGTACSTVRGPVPKLLGRSFVRPATI